MKLRINARQSTHAFRTWLVEVWGSAWRQFFRLMNFLTWYVIALAAVFYVLPLVGLFLQGRYDVMATSVKVFSILGFFAVVAIYHKRAR